MKKYSLAIIVFLGAIFSSAVAAATQPPSVTAEAVIVMDADSGRIICEHNGWERRPPASLTKVMTAILALELADEEDIFTVSTVAAETGESHIGFKAGEKISLQDVLYGALLRSGNDACVVIAENIAASEAHFAQMMNLKARLLGCTDTNFINSNGLPQVNHYSTCYDLALISRYALHNEKFRQIVSSTQYTMHWQNGREKTIRNTNRLLLLYDGAIGVKTGTTDAAGQCLIAAAEREDKCYIVVVLKSKDRFGDSIKLLDYAFSLKEQ